MYRRIPLPREQRGGLFCLFSLDQYNDTPCGCDFPHQSSSWSPCVYESRLQKHFRVTFEANPNHIQEIIQINITATRWGLTFLPVGLFSYLKRTRFPLGGDALVTHYYFSCFWPQWQRGAALHPERQCSANLHPCAVPSRHYILSVSSSYFNKGTLMQTEVTSLITLQETRLKFPHALELTSVPLCHHRENYKCACLVTNM